MVRCGVLQQFHGGDLRRATRRRLLPKRYDRQHAAPTQEQGDFECRDLMADPGEPGWEHVATLEEREQITQINVLDCARAASWTNFEIQSSDDRRAPELRSKLRQML